MKKTLIYIAMAFLSLLLLIISGSFYLLGTESGAQFSIAQTEKLLNGSLHIGSTKGKVLDRLELSDILFKNSAGITKIGHLVLDWKTTDLFNLHLNILEFTADDLSYTVFPQENAPAPQKEDPLTLPELNLPVKITLEKLTLNNFLFYSSPDTDAIAVHKAELNLSWNTNGINIQKLSIRLDEADLQAVGKLNPVGNYPFQLTTAIKTLTPALPSLVIDGIYSGDLQTIKVQQKISGDITAQLDMTTHQILNELTWKGDMEITELRPATFSPGTPGIVSGSLASNGNLQQAEVTSNLHIRDKKSAEFNWDADLVMQANLESLLFDIRKLTLKHAETNAHVKLTGTASTEQNLDLLLNWQDLQWPVKGDADYESSKGEAILKGTPDTFHLLLTAAIAGSQIPEGTIRLNTDGNTKSVENLLLTLDLLDGTAELQGDVQWSPVVKWDLSTEAKHINPGKHYPDWPGKLNWLIHTDGSIAENGATGNATIESLTGNVRELPISGTGKLVMQPGEFHIHNLQLKSGSAVITAQGNLGEKSNLQWKIDVTDVSDLIPGAEGQLKATGSVQEKMTMPLVTLNCSGSSISYSDLNLEQIDADVTLDLSWNTPFSLDLEAANLQSGETLIKTIAAKGAGTREKHTFHLKASHDMADIILNLNGGYMEEEWQGFLDTFDIISTDFGTWQLRDKKPSTLKATASSATLDTLCLSRENSFLCLKGSWNKESNTSKGDVQINEIPLTWFAPWFPETLEELTGLFSAKATATMQETLKADVAAEITPGNIKYITEKKTGTLPHEGMKLDLKIVDETLDADFLLSVDSNIFSGKIQSPDLLQKDIGSKAKLYGEIFVDAKKFDLVEALIPDVTDLDGIIDLDFKILGTIAEPDISGKGQVNIAHMLIPLAGLDLTGTTLNILADNQEVTVKGKLISPEGDMVLDGTVSLDSAKKFPARFTLKADNFRLIHLPEIEVFFSSDILFEKKDGLMNLTGEATIPKADILLRELPPGSQSVSPDMIIVQEQTEEEPKSPFRMLLKITLGDNVHFAGFGLNAFVDGQLTILSEPEEQIMGSGAFHIKQGSFRAYGQDLDIETGVISFPGGPLSQPGINLRATRTVGDVVAGIYAIGPARKPRLTTFSNPPMSESHVISYLLTGSSPADEEKGAKLSVGRQINSKLSVSVGTDVKTGDSEFITRYRLSRKIHVQTTTGSNSNAADIFYTIELENDDIKVPGIMP
ncbi:MAG: translocation/assembly module TamB domain-containing protein [Desulfocapsa sp.]|nr:translocation/assembly module TamB domain-containing protein [Desulfocapsa sp.]MBN4048695.1 translocation/assembly module TamB domain-containing protein [bacterium AH-315-N22]